MVVKTPRFRWVYASLWLVRIWFALYGMGYIHPDEHMQNGEVTAGNILDLHALITWEWRPELPLRSILPTFVTTGLPLLGLRLLFKPEQLARVVHPSLVFRIQRLVFLCLSGILDYSVLRLVPQPAPRRLALLLLASSYVTCTFQVRPFSNSLESVLVSLCLVLFWRVLDEWTRLKVGRGKTKSLHASKRDLHLLSVFAVIGLFTRPTFVAFALPIAYQLLRLSYQTAGSTARVVYLLLPPFCTAVVAASVFIATDTFYFRGNFSDPVITPYNFVTYNLSVENLADHGLHPNWLHVGVNLPLLLGPLLVWFAWCNAYECAKPSKHRAQKVHSADILRQTLIQIVTLSLSVLSLQPHQEPRFLTPLILPIIVLAATVEIHRPGKFFWVTWITFNGILGLVFGVLHQGGVVPSLLSLHSTLRDAAPGSVTQIVYWKTYMPPRHLLGVPRQDAIFGNLVFVDLSGAPQNELIAALSAPSSNSTYLVTPTPMYLKFSQGTSSCMTLKQRISPHLDLDHIPESIQAGVHGALSLGIYAVESGCIAIGSATQKPL